MEPGGIGRADDEEVDEPIPLEVMVKGREATLRARADARAIGPRGELATEELLRPLEAKGFVVLRDVAVPATRVSVDHVVIGPTGVFVVESKCWRIQDPVRESHSQLFSGPVYRGEEVDRLWWASSKVTNHARLSRFAGVTVQPVMCIHAAPFTRDVLELGGALAVSPLALTYVVLRPDRHLAPDAVAEVAAAVMGAFHPKLGGPWPPQPALSAASSSPVSSPVSSRVSSRVSSPAS